MTSDPFIIRPLVEHDLNFVRQTWMRAFADSVQRDALAESYWDDHSKVRDVLLERGHVVIAGLANEPTAICGWACTEPKRAEGAHARVHFVYVKDRWRKLGIARRLLAPFDSIHATYTHRTRLCERLPIPDHWTFHPYEAIK